MVVPVSPQSTYRFADFDVNSSAGELRRRGELIRLQDLPFRLLVALVERPGEPVTRTELRERLWGTDTFVDYEAGLNTAIAKLRDALGDNAEQPQFVETLPKRGYRFIGTIEPAAPRASTTETPVSAKASPREFNPVPAVEPGARPLRARAPMWLAALGLLVAAGASLYWARPASSVTRIAVVLFDNETGQPEFDRLAQQMTDAAVLKLTAHSELAVIGNAAILRTNRPFRDIIAIRDALHVRYIIIGQLQRVDGAIRAQAHLIRTEDQSHLWVDRVPWALGEAAMQEDMAARIERAVSQKVLRPVILGPHAETRRARRLEEVVRPVALPQAPHLDPAVSTSPQTPIP